VFLEKNNIERIESLDPLKDLKELQRLELVDNPITGEADYRQRVLSG